MPVTGQGFDNDILKPCQNQFTMWFKLENSERQTCALGKKGSRQLCFPQQDTRAMQGPLPLPNPCFYGSEMYYIPAFRPDRHQPHFVSTNNIKICLAKVATCSLSPIL